MSNYKQMPDKELGEAIEWLKDLGFSARVGSKESTHTLVLINNLNQLMQIWNHYHLVGCYRDAFHERNEIAKEIFVRKAQAEVIPNTADTREVEWTIHQCLQLADLFLEKSGSKEKDLAVMKERLQGLL